jgi:hypothetical protein
MPNVSLSFLKTNQDNLYQAEIFQCVNVDILEVQGDSKLLSGFPWLIIFKPEKTK